MKARDFLNFFLACVALALILYQFWNPGGNTPPKKPRPLTAAEKKTIAANLSDLVPPLGGVNLLTLARNVPEGEKPQKVEITTLVDNFDSLTDAQKERRGLAAFAGTPLALQSHSNKSPTKPKGETVELGSNDRSSPYRLFVKLDTKSGSVRQLLLNRFDEGTYDGKQGIGNLELIPEKLYKDENGNNGLPTRPSFVLYHYANSDDESPRAFLGQTVWEKVEETKTGSVHSITFAKTVNGVRIEKTYSLEPGTYHVGLEIKLKRLDDQTGKFRYQLTGGHGLPIEGRWYTDTFRTAMIGYLEEGDFDRNTQDSRLLRQESSAIELAQNKKTVYAAVAVQYFASAVVVDNNQVLDPKKTPSNFVDAARPTLEGRIVKVKLDEDLVPNINKPLRLVDKDDRNPDREPTVFNFKPGVITQPYKRKDRLGLLCEPDYNGDLQVLRVMPEDLAHTTWYDDVTVRVKSIALDLKKNQEVVHKYLLYNGPVKVGLLKTQPGISDELVNGRYKDALHLNTMTDWHSATWIGRFANAIYWSDLVIMFTNLLHGAFALIYSLIGNNGICIIILTVLVRLMMYPVSRKQAMTGIKMQALGPEMKKLKEQYKDDKQALTQKTMELYRKHGVNPFGSCWMLLLQLPIFMGLYWALRESIQFRLAEFLWIKNLAAPDMLFEWGKGIPFISADSSYGSLLYLGPYFNILPLLAISVMILQQKVMMPPAQDEQQAAQQKMMRYMMILFAFFFYKVAAGLCIYFVVSSLWGFAERKLMPKKDDPLKTPPPSAEKPAKKESVWSKPEKNGSGKKGKAGKKSAKGATSQPASPQVVELSWWGKVKNWWNEVLDKAQKK